MDKEKIKGNIKRFEDLHALVIGDVMIDAYYWGAVNRINPEAPVPIVDINEINHRMGGAANVALNLKTLGAKPTICSVIGNDPKGKLFLELLDNHGFEASGLIQSSDRRTTTKTRIISQGQHLLRIDEEDSSPISEILEEKLLQRVTDIINSDKPDVIIFEDYNKGVLTESLISQVIDLANSHQIPTTVDPKKDNFFAYQNCTLFKPNLKELNEGTKMEIKMGTDDLKNALTVLEEKLKNKISLITLSEHGVVVKEGMDQYHIPAFERKILDVSGAGDTVISVASLCLALNMPIKEIALLSNLAGGMVCELVGVVPIQKEALLKEVDKKLN